MSFVASQAFGSQLLFERIIFNSILIIVWLAFCCCLMLLFVCGFCFWIPKWNEIISRVQPIIRVHRFVFLLCSLAPRHTESPFNKLSFKFRQLLAVKNGQLDRTASAVTFFVFWTASTFGIFVWFGFALCDLCWLSANGRWVIYLLLSFADKSARHSTQWKEW